VWLAASLVHASIVDRGRRTCTAGSAAATRRGTAHGAAPVVNELSLLKSNDQGNKKALIGKTNQSFLRRWKVESIRAFQHL
jgi:hypothetical protein